MANTRLWMSSMTLLFVGLACGETPSVTCANFNQASMDFLQCGFDETTEVCTFYIEFPDNGPEKSCRQHCEGVVGGTCAGPSEDETSKMGAERCQGSGEESDCDEEWGSVICQCTL